MQDPKLGYFDHEDGSHHTAGPQPQDEAPARPLQRQLSCGSCTAPGHCPEGRSLEETRKGQTG